MKYLYVAVNILAISYAAIDAAHHQRSNDEFQEQKKEFKLIRKNLSEQKNELEKLIKTLEIAVSENTILTDRQSALERNIKKFDEWIKYNLPTETTIDEQPQQDTYQIQQAAHAEYSPAMPAELLLNDAELLLLKIKKRESRKIQITQTNTDNAQRDLTRITHLNPDLQKEIKRLEEENESKSLVVKELEKTAIKSSKLITDFAYKPK